MSQQKIKEASIVEEVWNSWIWIPTVGAALFLFYQYTRIFFYPCITPFELDNALKSLQAIYQSAKEEAEDEVIDPQWDGIADDFLGLKIAASKIREQHLQESSRWWEFVGINPGLMPAIARWYTESEGLKRRILKAQERDNQNRFEAERYRRRNARSWHSLPASFYASAHENPFRYRTADAVYSSSEGTHITNTIQDHPPTSRSDEIVPGVNSRQAPNNVAARARRTYPNDGGTLNATM